MVNLGTIIEYLQCDEIDLLPDFQRAMNLWDDTTKSRLIESLIMGLPLPSFYFAAQTKKQDNGKTKEILLVVDGLQRLCSIKDFVIDQKLSLQGLEFLGDEYQGLTFDGLSREDKRKISGAKVTYYSIDKSTPEHIKFIIFKRVNTGGLVLTTQEMRHALNQGVPAKFIGQLAESTAFKKATAKKSKTDRMQDKEFVNRFIAFYLSNPDTHYHGDIDSFLNDGMKKLKSKTAEQLDAIETSFIQSMATAYKIFGKHTFRNGPVHTYGKDTSQVEYAKQISKKQGRCELTAHYLHCYGKDNIADECLTFDGGDNLALHHNVQGWMKAISPGINIHVESSESDFKINYSFSRGKGKTSTNSFKATNIDFGISYVLPIVISALHARKGSLILIENPEAHIHPAGQAKLMALICLAANVGVQFVIETHSDHIINGLLLAVKKKTLKEQAVSLYFLDRKESTQETEVYPLAIAPGGRIKNPPQGFFDQIDLDMKALLGF
jgi:predicted ATPase